MEFQTFLESNDGTPQHIIDRHKKEATRRMLTLKSTKYADNEGITSKTHKGTLFSTDYHPKTGSYSHEENTDS